jgi:hypothetical protein
MAAAGFRFSERCGFSPTPHGPCPYLRPFPPSFNIRPGPILQDPEIDFGHIAAGFASPSVAASAQRPAARVLIRGHFLHHSTSAPAQSCRIQRSTSVMSQRVSLLRALRLQPNAPRPVSLFAAIPSVIYHPSSVPAQSCRIQRSTLAISQRVSLLLALRLQPNARRSVSSRFKCHI